MAKKMMISWSSGKDSAWMLYQLQKRNDLELTGLFCTVSEEFKRVSMHGVRIDLLELQAKTLQLPLSLIKIPYPCSHEIYANRMSGFVDQAKNDKIEQFAFGDIFLEDVRKYREEKLAETGITPIFPLWGIDSKELAPTMIKSGLKARLTCVNLKKMDKSFAGREYNEDLLNDLPENVDPCGENGEFHTFVYDGPMFSQPIDIVNGEVVERDGLAFVDLMIKE